MKTIIGFLFLVISFHAGSTTQQTDFFIFDGILFETRDYPLEPAYDDAENRPAFRTGKGALFSTDNVRGYRAVWTVRDNQLYLIGINTFLDKQPATLRDLDFIVDDAGIMAAWFTGELKVIHSHSISLECETYVETIEYGLIVQFSHGVLISSTPITTDQEIAEARNRVCKPEVE